MGCSVPASQPLVNHPCFPMLLPPLLLPLLLLLLPLLLLLLPLLLLLLLQVWML